MNAMRGERLAMDWRKERAELSEIHDAMNVEFSYRTRADAVNRQCPRLKKILHIGKVTLDNMRQTDDINPEKAA